MSLLFMPMTPCREEGQAKKCFGKAEIHYCSHFRSLLDEVSGLLQAAEGIAADKVLELATKAAWACPLVFTPRMAPFVLAGELLLLFQLPGLAGFQNHGAGPPCSFLLSLIH